MNTTNLFSMNCFRPPLISKGLRLAIIVYIVRICRFQVTPDFKGIKTQALAHIQKRA